MRLGGIVCAGVLCVGLLVVETSTTGSLAFSGASRLGLFLLVWTALAGIPHAAPGSGHWSGPLLSLPCLTLAAILDLSSGWRLSAVLGLAGFGLILFVILERAARAPRVRALHAGLWLLLVVTPALASAARGYVRGPDEVSAGITDVILAGTPLVALHQAACASEREASAAERLGTRTSALLLAGILLASARSGGRGRRESGSVVE